MDRSVKEMSAVLSSASSGIKQVWADLVEDGACTVPPEAGDVDELHPGRPSLAALHRTCKAAQHLQGSIPTVLW